MTEFEYHIEDEEGYHSDWVTINRTNPIVTADTLMYHAGFHNYNFYDLYVSNGNGKTTGPVDSANISIVDMFVVKRR